MTRNIQSISNICKTSYLAYFSWLLDHLISWSAKKNMSWFLLIRLTTWIDMIKWFELISWFGHILSTLIRIDRQIDRPTDRHLDLQSSDGAKSWILDCIWRTCNSVVLEQYIPMLPEKMNRLFKLSRKIFTLSRGMWVILLFLLLDWKWLITFRTSPLNMGDTQNCINQKPLLFYVLMKFQGLRPSHTNLRGVKYISLNQTKPLQVMIGELLVTGCIR